MRVLALIVLAVLALLLLVIATQPWWLGALVERQLATSSGRDVRFGRAWFGLSLGLEPVARVRDVRIANASWADPTRPLADLRGADATFSWRSIAERRPVIGLLILRDGQLDLEREADGLRNWRLRDPEDRGPGRYKVLAIRGDNAVVRFRHAGIDLDLEARATPNETADARNADGEALPVRLDAKVSWRKVPFELRLETGPVLTFLETGVMFPLRGRIATERARVDLDGRAGDLFREPRFDAQMAFVATSMAHLSPFIGERWHEARALRIDGHLKTAPEGYSLAEAKGTIGKTDLAGDASYLRDGDRRIIRVGIHSESADVADLLWLADRGKAAKTTRAAAMAKQAASAVHPTGTSDKDLRAFDAKVKFSAHRLRSGDFTALQSAAFDAALDGGVLTLAGIDVGLAEGHAEGSATVDLNVEPIDVHADVALKRIRLEKILGEKAAKAQFAAALSGQARLHATGQSADSIARSVSGTVSAALGGGTISSLLDAKMGLQGGRMLRNWIGGAEPMPIRCAALALDVQRGKGSIRSLVLDTEQTRTTGSGTLDFAERRLDLVLTPVAKQRGLFILDRSIRLHGPWQKPERALVERAPAAAASPAGCAAERP